MMSCYRLLKMLMLLLMILLLHLPPLLLLPPPSLHPMSLSLTLPVPTLTHWRPSKQTIHIKTILVIDIILHHLKMKNPTMTASRMTTAVTLVTTTFRLWRRMVNNDDNDIPRQTNNTHSQIFLWSPKLNRAKGVLH